MFTFNNFSCFCATEDDKRYIYSLMLNKYKIYDDLSIIISDYCFGSIFFHYKKNLMMKMQKHLNIDVRKIGPMDEYELKIFIDDLIKKKRK